MQFICKFSPFNTIPYDRLLQEKELSSSWQCNNTEFKQALEKNIMMSTLITKSISLTLGDYIELFSFDPNVGKSQSKIKCKPMQIADAIKLNINGVYLLEALKCANNNITIYVKNPNKPIILHFEDGNINTYHLINVFVKQV
jgi:hypothetical protein